MIEEIKEFLPFTGNRKVRERIRDIKHIELSLPILLATSITKIYESFVAGSSDVWNWMLSTLLICIVYIYWDIIREKTEKLEVKDD